MRYSAVGALLVDALAGEPPAAVHPTVWMGKWIAAGKRLRTAAQPLPSLTQGALLLGSGLAVAGLVGASVGIALARWGATGAALEPFALKPALSLRPLVGAASVVRAALAADDLSGAREALSTHLVSRDTSQLSREEVAGAAIESVAENLSDSVVAPLLAFRFGGLGAAYAYRLVNTADAMLGYHTRELEWFGKPAARTDDLLNLVPSRLSAALVSVLAPAGGGSSRAAVSVAFKDAGHTASPNAGWPMAAMAGALGVRLTKRDHYALNDGGRAPEPYDIARACRIVVACGIAAAALTDLL